MDAAEPALVDGGHDARWVTEKVCGIVEGPAPRWWWIGFIASAAVALVAAASICHLVATGIGVWGLGGSVFWGWAIVNFVFWIGIAHAGTLISAILCLLRQKWRTSVSRAAEAMTLFAVACAAIFPVVHMGRAWFGWWLLPVPEPNTLWPQFRSPLVWDVFAVSTYATVSLLFWYLGMVPDLATLRDRAKSRLRQVAYGILAIGWRNSSRHWVAYEGAYLLLAGIATPLVLSVHTIVSFDFSVANLPGWHSTIFPPYFVAGAIFSGIAMVLTIMLPLRSLLRLEHLVTAHHIECLCKICLATGCMVGYAYAMEVLVAWYGADPYEGWAFLNRAFGPYWWAYLAMLAFNIVLPQLLWSARFRRNLLLLWLLSVAINVGMWLERFVITVSSLASDFMPANWSYYTPTVFDVSLFAGTFGLFAMLFLLFIRFLPLMPMAEIKANMESCNPTPGHGKGHGHD